MRTLLAGCLARIRQPTIDIDIRQHIATSRLVTIARSRGIATSTPTSTAPAPTPSISISRIIRTLSTTATATTTTTPLKMSTTIYHPYTTPPIPITIPHHLTPLLSSLSADPTSTARLLEPLLTHPPFKIWFNTLQHSLSLQKTNPAHPFHKDPYELKHITINNIDVFGPRGGPKPPKIGFVNLHADVRCSDPAEAPLPGIVFLRGGSVAILVIVEPEADAQDGNAKPEPLIILTQQPRIPVGSLSLLEIPAGMIESTSPGSGSAFSGTAAKELQEELGLTIRAEDLLDLCALAGLEGVDSVLEGGGVFPSPGGSDEHITLFAYVHKGGRREEWEGKVGGLREDGERIVLRIVEAGELWRKTRDMKTLAAWALWEGLKREGRV
ncbi:hypothetical protein DFH27DRAFT_532606 [Peziza echinospora]|nr:hypothetical protein DFH27DRAFT_532606 [Peziza echinospora]